VLHFLPVTHLLLLLLRLLLLHLGARLTYSISTSACCAHAPQLSNPGLAGLLCGVDEVGLNILDRLICSSSRQPQQQQQQLV
jgi:hypothetical protein